MVWNLSYVSYLDFYLELISSFLASDMDASKYNNFVIILSLFSHSTV